MNSATLTSPQKCALIAHVLIIALLLVAIMTGQAWRADPSDRDHMAALEKGLAVIECFDAEHDKLTIAEVARATDLSRAAARRCLLTLTRRSAMRHSTESSSG
jgi:hypothetical protein